MNGEKTPRRRLIGLALLGFGASALPLHAAGPSGSPIRLDGSSISFPAGALSFPSGALSFPSSPVQAETASTVEVTLPADVLFDFDKADIRPVAQTALRELADIIHSKARGPVAVQGHTDALGSDAYNQKLSERRANAVKAWLSGKEGVPARTLSASGYGARNPVAPNRRPDGSDDPDGRQLNRRVTVIIRK